MSWLGADVAVDDRDVIALVRHPELRCAGKITAFLDSLAHYTCADSRREMELRNTFDAFWYVEQAGIA